MMEKVFQINQSDLEGAKNIGDEEWLESTFGKAAQIIERGGKVNIMQQFSDGSKELTAIIDTIEMLDYYKRKYL